MYQKDLLRKYIKDSELRVFKNKIKVRLSKDLAVKYDQGVYNNYLNKMLKCYELISALNIKYPSNANPEFYIYIVPDESCAEMLSIPETFNNGKGGGKPVGCQDLDGFNYAYGVSQNRCENHPNNNGNIMSFANNVHELAHLVHGQFFGKSSLLGEGFAEALSLYTLGLEEEFSEHEKAIKNLTEDKIYTAQELLTQERENSFGKEALVPNKSCSFRLSYISSYLFVRGIIQRIEKKYNLNKKEATQNFLEMIRQSNYSNEWLIFDIADTLDMSHDELLNGKQMQISIIKELLEQELSELNLDIKALEKQFKDKSIKEGKTEIEQEIKTCSRRIGSIEDRLGALAKNEKENIKKDK